MGKEPTAAPAPAPMKRKKKGRPPKNRILVSTPDKTISYDSAPSTGRRSIHRNPKNHNSPPPEYGEDDDEDERKEKKVKLVVRLPESDQKSKAAQKQHKKRHSCDDDSGSDSGSGPESESESEDRDSYAKKQKINDVDRGFDGVSLQEQKAVKATGTALHGSPLESGPTTPLPDKKLLIFILDRIQKKDTYGVFSEPVDPNELPDYFEVIERPMDFGTVRKKLDDGAYRNLEELEAEVFLICSNAMVYNAPDTVYYKQARSMQDLAKRDFQNLKHEGDDGEPQPKVVRRGRPPGNKNQKLPLETSPVDRVGPEPSQGATLASNEEKASGSSAYNLRKGTALNRYPSTDPFVSSYRPRNGEYSEWSADWNNEFPASILRADMKHGKKHFTVDETRRDTYRQFNPISSGNSAGSSNYNADMRRLVPVGLQEPFGYARSLARYAADLGTEAWKIASKRIESVIPAGTQYGPGWVSENAASSQPLSFSTEKQKSSSDCNSGRGVTPSTSDLSSAVAYGLSEEMIEAVRKINSQNEQGLQGDTSSWRTPFPAQQKPVYPPQRNGFSGMLGYDLSAAEAKRVAMPAHPMMQGVPQHSQIVEPGHVGHGEARLPESWNSFQPGYPVGQARVPDPHGQAGTWNIGKSGWQAMLMQQRPHQALTVQPDLNVRFQAGASPRSSGLQPPIGSPQQPDLALQL